MFNAVRQRMARTVLYLSLLGAGLAFGAACATLALMGLGVPMLLGAVGAAAAAGLVLNATLRTALARPIAAMRAEADRAGAAATSAATSATAAHLADIEARAATLRHDLRGVLSPALMVTDRLLNNPEPTVQRAGQAVIRSVERATAIIQASKPEPAATAPAPSTEPAGPAAE